MKFISGLCSFTPEPDSRNFYFGRVSGFRKYIAAYFTFTRKERVGVVFLLVLVMLLVFLPFLFPYFIPEKKYSHALFENEIAALKIKQDSPGTRQSGYEDNSDPVSYASPERTNYSSTSKGTLFYFDPNTLPAEGWIKLGIREKTAQTIQNYLSKGGWFYKPEDISKIWGLHKDEVSRLLPYVRIEKRKENEAVFTDRQIAQAGEKKSYAKNPIDINTADTAALIALPGIGSKLANRIIAFRDKLGGFYSVSQVAETYGLPDSTFQKIKDRLRISNASLKQLNINTAGPDELKTHPYIRYAIANAIIQYRNQHGNFSAVDELKNIMIINADLFNKLQPYLTVR